MVLCELNFPRSRPIVIGSIYRPPQQENFYTSFIDYMNNLDFTNIESYLIGDFNCKGLTNAEKQFVKSMNDLGFHQLIKEPTRVTAISSSLIDLIFTNSPHQSTASGVLKLSLSDHYMIYCNRSCKIPKDEPKIIKVRSFNKFECDAFLADLETLPWGTIYMFDSPDDAWFAIEELLTDVCDKHAPLRTMRVKGLQPPWMNGEILQSIKSRNVAKRKVNQKCK